MGPMVNIEFGRIQETIENGGHGGFCLACGDSVHGVEPDAREYTCGLCGEDAVYGAEEILVMGRVQDG